MIYSFFFIFSYTDLGVPITTYLAKIEKNPIPIKDD